MALWESNPKPKKRPTLTRRAGSGEGGRRASGRPGTGGSGVRGTRSSRGWQGGGSGRSYSGTGGGGSKGGGKRSIISGGSLKDYPFLRQYYQHQAVINDGLQKFLFVLMIAALIYAFVLGDGGAIRILVLRHKTAQLDREIAALQANVQDISYQIDRLKDDPFFIEKVGREKLGLIKPGDDVIKLVPQSGQGRSPGE